jgi:hypothetical protein
VAVLGAWHAGKNYFHWMFNVLPRLELRRLGGVELSTVDRFVINRPHLQTDSRPSRVGSGRSCCLGRALHAT